MFCSCTVIEHSEYVSDTTPNCSHGHSLSAAKSPWLMLLAGDIRKQPVAQAGTRSSVAVAMCIALNPAGMKPDKSISASGNMAGQQIRETLAMGKCLACGIGSFFVL